MSKLRMVYAYLTDNVKHIPPRDAVEYFRNCFLMCCKKYGCARDSLINHTERVEELKRTLGNGWGHIPNDDIRKLLGNITRNPSDFGYPNGEWKATKSTNHGKNTKNKELTNDAAVRVSESDWPDLRRRCIERDKVCRCCGGAAIQAHHTPQGYAKMRTPEEIDYITAVCVPCHAMITARMKHTAKMDEFVDKLLGSMASVMKKKFAG